MGTEGPAPHAPSLGEGRDRHADPCSVGEERGSILRDSVPHTRRAEERSFRWELHRGRSSPRWAEEAPRAPIWPWWAWLPRSAPPGGVGVLCVSAGVCTVRTQWCPWPTSHASRDHSFVCSFTPSLTNAD